MQFENAFLHKYQPDFIPILPDLGLEIEDYQLVLPQHLSNNSGTTTSNKFHKQNSTSQICISSAIKQYQYLDLEIEEAEIPENLDSIFSITTLISKKLATNTAPEITAPVIPQSDSMISDEDGKPHTSSIYASLESERNAILRSATQDSDRQNVAIEGEGTIEEATDLDSSGTEDGAFATGEEESDGDLSGNCSAEDGSSATATQDASSSDDGTNTITTGTDTSNNDATFDLCRRHVLPLVARPAALLAAVFPWSREGEVQVRKNLVRVEVTGSPLLTVEGETATAATMVVRPWVHAREMIQRCLHLPLRVAMWEWWLEEGNSNSPQTLMGQIGLSSKLG